MSKQVFNPKTMPKKAALEVIRTAYGLEGQEAEFALAIMRGETDGDVKEEKESRPSAAKRKRAEMRARGII